MQNDHNILLKSVYKSLALMFFIALVFIMPHLIGLLDEVLPLWSKVGIGILSFFVLSTLFFYTGELNKLPTNHQQDAE